MSQTNQLFTKPVTFAAGANVSAPVLIDSDFTLVGLRTAAGWTTTNITLESSFDGPQTPPLSVANFAPCVDGSCQPLTISNIAASKHVCLTQDWPVISGVWLRFTSVTAQAAAGTLLVIFRMT